MSAVAPQLVLGWEDWLSLFGHYLMLSLMSLGGAISTSSEMHRFLVEQHHWLTQAQFNESIALAQAAPGPNVLFVALMGWHVGMNAGSMPLKALTLKKGQRVRWYNFAGTNNFDSQTPHWHGNVVNARYAVTE